jgi:hypothetical protein
LAHVEAELCTLAGQIAAATSRFLHLLADFDARQGWAGWNIRSCAHWLSWRCGLDLRTAREHVRVARALARLPKIREAFDAGEISYSKVRAIARVATPTSEGDLLEAALHSPAAHVERLARGLRTAQTNSEAPDDLGLQPLPATSPTHQTRWHWDDETGDLIISGRLTAEDGARFLAAATRAGRELNRADPVHSADGSAEPSAQPALVTRPPSDLGPALVAMADIVRATTTAPIHAPAAEMLVTVDIDTFVNAFSQNPRGQASPAEAEESRPGLGARIDDGPALAAAAVRRLADDGRLRLAVLAGDGRTLDLGRARRSPNAAQLRALWRRDRGCAAPGCTRTRFLHAHHTVYWTHGGKTDLDNLVLLCGEHHRALHEGAFTVTALGRQQFRFTGPDDAVAEPAPHVEGSLNELATAHPEITPDTIGPDWDGTPLRASAISTYLSAWAATIRRGGEQRRAS